MASLSVSGIARLTRDAEERKVNGGAWYNFGIAAYRRNAKEGKQAVDFFDAELYLKGDNIKYAQSLKKGNLIYIENAFIRNDQFQGADGQQKTKYKLLIMTFDILNEKIDMGNEKVVEPVKEPIPVDLDNEEPPF